MMLLGDIVSWILLVSGCFLCITGGIGLVRLPDFWARAHAAGINDSLGAGLILAGLMFQSGLSLVTVKLIMIVIFIFITSPTAGHALYRSAHGHGVPFTPETRIRTSEEAARVGSN